MNLLSEFVVNRMVQLLHFIAEEQEAIGRTVELVDLTRS